MTASNRRRAGRLGIGLASRIGAALRVGESSSLGVARRAEAADGGEETARERCASHLAAAALLLGAGALTGCGSEPAPFEHLILISLDTTRADHLGCYGSGRQLTPSIDALAAEGIVFRDVTAPAPTTLASHASMMTGSYPQTHGIPRNGFVINDTNVMLAEILSSVGFHTAAILGSFALERRFSFNQGFDWFDEEFETLIMPGGVDQNQRSGASVTRAALEHVDEAKPERLFLFAHYFDAHLPYTPPQEYAEKHTGPGGRETVSMQDAEQQVAHHQFKVTGEAVGLSGIVTVGLSRPLVEQALARPLKHGEDFAKLYAAEVEAMDAAIGDLLVGLDQRGYLDKALVVITGDHGETFWEHGDVWNHGLWVHQTTVAVPLIMRFPDGQYRRARITEPVSTIDLVPTLCELLGVPVGPLVEGKSLVPALEGDEFERGVIYSQATQPMGRYEPRAQWRNLLKPRCIRDGKWKYVNAPYLELEQLYDLSRDPGERNNLLAGDLTDEQREVRERLRTQLEEWVATADPLKSPANTEQMEETFERLKAMGYGGGGAAEDSGGEK